MKAVAQFLRTTTIGGVFSQRFSPKSRGERDPGSRSAPILTPSMNHLHVQISMVRALLQGGPLGLQLVTEACSFSLRSDKRAFCDQLIRREQRLLNSRRLYARKRPAEREGSMTKRSLMFALGATLLLSGSTAAVSATPHSLSRYCAVDLNSLCAGIKPARGAIVSMHECEDVGSDTRFAGSDFALARRDAQVTQNAPKK